LRSARSDAVALQGTLDTFGLPDVLRLLAGTRKTGRLRVTGDRANGSVWMDGGAIVAGSTSSLAAQADLATVLFDLLRCRDGSFVFEPDINCGEAGAPTDVEALVSAAETLLAEWREIEAVVPSLAMWVTLVPELPRPEVVVSAPRWRALVAVGSGAQVGAVGEDLELDEIEVSRLIKELVELSLVEITALMPEPEPQPEPEIEAEPVLEIEPQIAVMDAIAVVEEFPVGPVDHVEPEPEPISAPEALSRPPAHLGIDIPGLPSLGGWGDVEDEVDTIIDHEPGDVSVELGPLTPRAARAIAAAAQASNEAEREAAIQQAIEANDQPLDRGVLLRFLSSVRH
jgi:hypothetical protein